MFNWISNLISIPIEKNFLLKQHIKKKLLTQNRQNKSKAKHISKAISKTKLIQKQISGRGADDMSSGRQITYKSVDDVWMSTAHRWSLTPNLTLVSSTHHLHIICMSSTHHLHIVCTRFQPQKYFHLKSRATALLKMNIHVFQIKIFDEITLFYLWFIVFSLRY